MHAQQIIHKICLPPNALPSTPGVAPASPAWRKPRNDGSLSLMGMSRVVSGAAALHHRIKRCDRLLGNSKLGKERHLIYGAMARRLLRGMAQPLIIVDWSDLCPDRSQPLLRAALIVRVRALTLYEEVHPLSMAACFTQAHAALHDAPPPSPAGKARDRN